MTSNLSGGARVCGEQDCGERTGRPSHPLCYTHYLAWQGGDIDECPDCAAGVYKPAGYRVCRSCGMRGQGEVRRPPQGDSSRGWGLQPAAETKAAPPRAVEAVERVRRNMTAHERACVNNEANTIQFLIMPMLRGLGWDDDDPEQVIREYKPAGRGRFRASMAVDIALLDRGMPKVFVEAKRLDREYTPEYSEQLDKYASYMGDGGVAALTNGRHWLIHSVVAGETRHRLTVDLAEGDAGLVAGEINDAIGKDVICGGGAKAGDDRAGGAVAGVSGQRRVRAEGDGRRRAGEAIAEGLREYREREARRRRQPAYIILKDDTIGLIAENRPTDLGRLRGIRGVGPATLELHGEAIIEIVRRETGRGA